MAAYELLSGAAMDPMLLEFVLRLFPNNLPAGLWLKLPGQN